MRAQPIFREWLVLFAPERDEMIHFRCSLLSRKVYPPRSHWPHCGSIRTEMGRFMSGALWLENALSPVAEVRHGPRCALSIQGPHESLLLRWTGGGASVPVCCSALATSFVQRKCPQTDKKTTFIFMKEFEAMDVLDPRGSKNIWLSWKR